MSSFSRLVPMLIAVAVALSACCGDDEAEVDHHAAVEEAKLACPVMGKVQDDFGATIRSKYGHAFIEYWIHLGGPNEFYITPPVADPCSLEIAIRLEQACTICQQTPDICVELITALMNATSAKCSVCGDGKCGDEENLDTCALDCHCGNGFCEYTLGEDPASCPTDCSGACGDSYCAAPVEACVCDESSDDDCRPCPADCCRGVCGDMVCDAGAGENILGSDKYCEFDCAGGFCGDGICAIAERDLCDADCGGFVVCDGQNAGRCCGDGLCVFPESCANCADCSKGDACLDGVCGMCEFFNCAADCQGVEFECGDGTCGANETSGNCPGDCPLDRTLCGNGVCDIDRGEGATQGLVCPADCGPDSGYEPYTEPTCGYDNVCWIGERGVCNECSVGCQPVYTCMSDEAVCAHAYGSGIGEESGNWQSCEDGLDNDGDGLADCSDPDCRGKSQCTDTWEMVADCSTQVAETFCSSPSITFCQGRCGYDLDGRPSCIDQCPRTLDEPSARICPPNFEPQCLSDSVRLTCITDPAYSTDPDCMVLGQEQCPSCLGGECNGQGMVLNSLAPQPAYVGTELHIVGLGFGSTPGEVYLGAQSVPPLEWSNSEVVVAVPAGVAPGNLTLTRSDGNSRTIHADVYGYEKLRVEPWAATQGSEVEFIGGPGFGPEPALVRFATSQDPAEVTAWSAADGYRALVPLDAEAREQEIRLYDVNDEWIGSIDRFYVIAADPSMVLTHFEPRVVYWGDELHVFGAGFGATAQQMTVGGSETEIVSWTDTEIVGRIAINIRSGRVRVTRDGELRESAAIVAVLGSLPPVITSFSPLQGVAGTRVTIYGEHLSPTGSLPTVTIGDGLATTVSASDTEVRVDVTTANTSARIQLTRDDGAVAVSTDAFRLALQVAGAWSCQAGVVRAGSTLHLDMRGLVVGGGNPIVTFGGGAQVVATSWTAFSIDVVVPYTAVTGIVSIRQGSESGSMTSALTIEPDVAAHEPAWPMPDSPTALCIDDVDAAACASEGNAWYGQDGNFLDPAPNTSVTAQNTVLDALTGLEWQIDVNSNGPTGHGWEEAHCTCENLTLAGNTDWRLPSVIEALTIADLGSGSVGPNFQGGGFPIWTIDQRSVGTRFAIGGAGTVMFPPPTQASVRCVRGNPGTVIDRFTLTANTAIDDATGLEWDRLVRPSAAWQDALATCSNLDTDGHTDWRLASLKELLTTLDFSSVPPENAAAFTEVPLRLWTSTPLANGDVVALDPSSGYTEALAKATSFNYRCVRTSP